MFTTFEATGLEDLVEKSTRVDSLGKVHVRFGQTINGIAVDGADLIVHAHAAAGAVYAVNGLMPDQLPDLVVDVPGRAHATAHAASPQGGAGSFDSQA